MLKLPAIFAEVILGILIYKKLSIKVSKFYAILGSLFIFLNPALIFNSSVWGQVDGVFVLSIYLVVLYLEKENLVLSSALLGLSFLLKPQTIAIFPLFLLALIKNFALQNFVKISIPFLILCFTLSLPFFPNKPFNGLIDLILSTISQYQYSSLFAYNFWGIFGFWISDNQTWNNLSYQNWGYILFAIYWIIISYFYLKKKMWILPLAVLAALSFYFLPTRIHERYLYPAIVFLIFYSFSIKSKLLIILTTILSIIHFLNLYYVYVYYNEFYLKLPKLLYIPLLYNFLDVNGKLLSFTSVILFILISIVIIKSQHADNKA